jgi:Zn-finger protein
MMRFLERLFCNHYYLPFYNVYGDEIIYRNYNRSVWKCNKCGKETARRELVEGLGMRPDVQQMIDDLKEHRPDLF